tara:strand:- start:155 stop:343 length:189 start_codon:yes stop_codon:yes gene_type:complete
LQKENKITHTELQNLMLKYRISINELFNMTGIPVNHIKGYLAGRRTIPTHVVDRIKQIGENQ